MRWPVVHMLATALALGLGLGPGLGGCASERPPPECKEVCRKEARCVDVRGATEGGEAAEARFDQSECIAACTALGRDPDGKKLVENHVICVEKAGDDCAAILDCP